MKKKLYTILVVMIFIISCNSNNDKIKVENFINNFYNKIALKDYKAAYNFFDDEFKQQASEEDLKDFLSKVKDDCGNYLSKDQMSWNTTQSTNTDSKLYNLTFKVKYVKKVCREDISLIVNDDKITIKRYDITSEKK